MKNKMLEHGTKVQTIGSELTDRRQKMINVQRHTMTFIHSHKEHRRHLSTIFRHAMEYTAERPFNVLTV